MIHRDALTPVGRVNKPHGINGEMSVSFDIDVDDLREAIAAVRCLVIMVDEIPVPFFVESIRSRGADSLLLKFDGVDSEAEAAKYTLSDVYAFAEDLPGGAVDNEEGMYAGDLIGYTAIDDDTQTAIGEITDIDDSTENVLFIIERPDGEVAMIPVADEFITAIDPENRTITFSLPHGLL